MVGAILICRAIFLEIIEVKVEKKTHLYTVMPFVDENVTQFSCWSPTQVSYL